MEIIFIVIAFLLLIAGLLGVIIPILPGPPLSFAGLVVLQLSGFADFPFLFLLIWGIITLGVTVIDYVLPSIMARRFGGSRAASIGSILGLILWLIFFPPLGFIVGPFLGALAGELIYQGTQKAEFNRRALTVAFGAFFAFILGSGTKLIVCGFMLYYGIRAVFSIG